MRSLWKESLACLICLGRRFVIDQSCQKYRVQCEDWSNFLSNLTRNNLFKSGDIGLRSPQCVGRCGPDELVSLLFFECLVLAGI